MLPKHIDDELLAELAMNLWANQRAYNLSTRDGDFDTEFYTVAARVDPNDQWLALPIEEKAIFLGAVINVAAYIMQVPHEEVADRIYEGLPVIILRPEDEEDEE